MIRGVLAAILTASQLAQAGPFGQQQAPFNPPALEGYGCMREASASTDMGTFIGLDHFATQTETSEYFAVAKLRADGSLDTTWGEGGIARMPDFPGTTVSMNTTGGLFALSDGGVLVSQAARFDRNGRLDASFFRNVRAATVSLGDTIAEQPDGKLVSFVMKPSTAAITGAFVRFTRDGQIDRTFGSNGFVETGLDYSSVYAWSVMDDGSVEVGSFPMDAQGAPQMAPRLQRFPADFPAGSARRLMPHIGLATWVSPAVKADPFGGVVFASILPDTSLATLTRFDASGGMDLQFGGARVLVTGSDPLTSTTLQPIALWRSANGSWNVILKSAQRVVHFDADHAIRAVRFRADGSADPDFTQGMKIADQPLQLTQRDDASMVRAATGATSRTCTAVRQSTETPRVEATLVEYYNPDLDHYFMTLDGFESALLDANADRMHWVRTGYTMGAWSASPPAGATPVCRFYGDPVIGPNSHFYTPQGPECDFLVQLDHLTPAGRYAWHLEGIASSVTVPANGACPANLTPVLRLFNGKSGGAQGDPNHRYTTSDAVIEQMRARGWLLEGLAFCVPPQASRDTLRP